METNTTEHNKQVAAYERHVVCPLSLSFLYFDILVENDFIMKYFNLQALLFSAISKQEITRDSIIHLQKKVLITFVFLSNQKILFSHTQKDYYLL
jgi:hypothetical protein